MNTHPYANLTPDLILDAVDSIGYRCDGRLLALNSYENRVYQIGLEDSLPCVAKFYRPERWSDAAILEEHQFMAELFEREIPVVPPWRNADGQTLHNYQSFRFALFPRQGGRAPDLDRPETLEWLGRYLGRIHAVGALQTFQARSVLTVERYGDEALAYLLAEGDIPADVLVAYRSVAELALLGVRRCFERAGPCRHIRLHGDCHAGNVLWTDTGPHFVDFDDSLMGPAIQDLWMLLSGEREECQSQLLDLLAGYEDFHEFDPRQLHLIEALRTLRLLHYSAWLARRWHDPAFPAAFPWFNTQRYWQDRILELREQVALMDEPPLVV